MSYKSKSVTLTYTAYNADFSESTEMALDVPAKNVMCDRCDGEGSVDNPAFSNGITSSDREEMGESEFRRYMSGAFDVVCPCCRGSRIVLQADVRSMSMAQKRFAVRARQDQILNEECAREDADIRSKEMAHCGY